MFEGFKAVVWCCVVGAGNNKVVRWCGGGGCQQGYQQGVDSFVSVDGLGDRVVDKWEMRKRLRELYPVKNAGFVIAF